MRLIGKCHDMLQEVDFPVADPLVYEPDVGLVLPTPKYPQLLHPRLRDGVALAEMQAQCSYRERTGVQHLWCRKPSCHFAYTALDLRNDTRFHVS